MHESDATGCPEEVAAVLAADAEPDNLVELVADEVDPAQAGDDE